MLIYCSWDDWVPHDRLRKFTEENKELAQDLKREMDDSRARAAPKTTSTKKKTAGSDFSSARGSEERHSSLPVTGRGSKRGRDMEIEKVCGFYFFAPSSPCPDLESDNSESGWSGAFDHANTPDVESEPVFACYDGTGDPPARRSERKPKPRAVFEQTPVPAPQPKRRRKASTATPLKVEEAAPDDAAATTKSALDAEKVIPSTTVIQAAKQKVISISGNQSEAAVATARALINNENSSTSNDMTVVEGKSTPPGSAKIKEEPSKAAVVTEEVPAASNVAPTESNVAPAAAAIATATIALPGTLNDRRSSSSLTPPPSSTDEAETLTPKTTAKSSGRKPATKSNAQGKERASASKPTTRSAASSKQKPTLETVSDISTVDPPKSAAKGKGKSKALPVDLSDASLEPVELQKGLEVTENGLSAEISRSTAKGTVKGKGKSSLPKAPSNALDHESPPDSTKQKVTSKAKGPKGKGKASLPAASETSASVEPGDILEGSENYSAPDPQKPKSQGKGAKAKANASPPESVPSFKPKTTLEVLQNDPPKSAKNSKKPFKPIFQRAQTKAKYLAEKTALLGEPQRISDSYLPESNRYHQHEEKHFFYAGIPTDMDRRPRRLMGRAKVSKQRAEWMTYRNVQRRAGLSRLEINRNWESILAEAEKSRLNPDATDANGNGQDSSISQGSQGSSSSSGSSKKRKSVTFADDVPDPDQDSMPKARRREESPRKRACTSKKLNLTDLRSYEFSQEESFHSRSAVRLPVSDHLKALLVDDWEAVTKNLSLVPLPSEHPVTEILANYLEEEKAKRRVGSAEYDLLEEVVAGVKEYFNRCLGRILLYRFEREQFFEISKLWDEGREGWEGKGASDAYGAEHLTRLFGTFRVLRFSVLH